MSENKSNAFGTYLVYHSRRNVWLTFWNCADADQARQRFQWVYGYWPDDVIEESAR